MQSAKNEDKLKYSNLLAENVGNNAFNISVVKKNVSYLLAPKDNHSKLSIYNSFAAPIIESKSEIIGYIGIFIERKCDVFGLINFVECLSILISLLYNNMNIGNSYDYLSNKLTNREQEVLKMIVDCKKNKEISSMLNISMTTVSAHTKNIFSKLEINSKCELISKYYNNFLSNMI